MSHEEVGQPGRTDRGVPFRETPLLLRFLVVGAAVAALLLPFLLLGRGRGDVAVHPFLTALALIALSVANVEIGRVLEGGIVDSQRPHKALSAWAFSAALLLHTVWLLPVVVLSYAHARWRGLRVPLWKWVGSGAYVVLSGLVAAALAARVMGPVHNFMAADGARGVAAVLAGAAAFLATETVLFHGSAYLNHADDEVWLRRTLASSSFYLTEGGVLLVAGLFAAIWTGGPWFVLLVLPVYAIAQLAALHEPLRERAETDGKTGLLRFESWRRLAVSARERCVARRQPWAVVFADLDHFKRYNDQHGHLAGDRALVAVAGALRKEVRADDLLGRFGGEEFSVFLPGTPVEEAAAIAERLRVAVARLRPAGPDDRLTVSLGVAGACPGEVDVEFVDVVSRADLALYEAKGKGRDRVCVQAVPDPAVPDLADR